MKEQNEDVLQTAENTKFSLKNLSISKVLQIFLNIALIILAGVLCILLSKEIYGIIIFIVNSDTADFHTFLEKILVFFLYFEFVSMIVKYFRENYHFPLRYFLYIGITAVTRLIIVAHTDPINTLYYALVILVLIISYFIINKTPKERP